MATRYIGVLVSIDWNKGTNQLHGRNTGINNATGGAFHFSSEDEPTRKWYANGHRITEEHPKFVTFFNKAFYEALAGQEGATISWERGRHGLPVNVQVEGIAEVLLPA